MTSETPLLDERKLAKGSILTQIDLDVIPTARDPWAVLNQAPGVLVDRINVGGNESARQSFFIAPGALIEDNSYLIDGVEITDSSVGGASSTYYDFDQFSQFELSTGGSEITKISSGVSINMVTKRGTNEARGSARFFVTDADGYFGILQQGDPQLDPDELGIGQDEAITGNRTDRNQEYGFEAGGPALRDRVWLWAAWANTNTRTLTADGQPQDYALENLAFKTNAQITGANSLGASWSTGNKTADARGAGPAVSREATYRQRGPSDILKLEDTHVFGSSFFLSGTWSKVGSGFQLAGQSGAGPTAPEMLWDSDGIWKQNADTYWTDRPSEVLQFDGSYFLSAGPSSHELKFGARFRDFSFRSMSSYPGRQLIHQAGENWGEEPGPLDFLSAWRTGEAKGNVEYRSLWLQDTITLGQWTVNAGLRWDLQEAASFPSQVLANPVFPEVLPALDYAGNDAGGFEWNTISPRVGATYALGAERQTLLRASYARFAQQLNAGYAWWVDPVGIAGAYFYFYDTNENNIWDGVEVDGEPGLLFCWNTDCFSSELDSPNLNDPGLDAPTTDELIFALEHSITPEFVVALEGTYRHARNLLEERQLIRDANGTRREARNTDFTLEHTEEGLLPDGSPYSVDFYSLDPDLFDTGGFLVTNGDRSRDYLGATLRATKRLSNQWMLRGYVNYGIAEWSIPESFYRFKDPTDFAGASGWSRTQTNQDNDGDVYFDLGRWGSLMQSSWAINVNGMYQVAPDRPWGFNIAGNLYGREGYPLPYYITYTSRVDGINRQADAVQQANQFRTNDIRTLDLRLEKEFAARSNVGLTFSIDAFNVFNENSVLRRELRLNGSRPDYVNETLAPRIYRLAVRLNWR